MSVSKFAYIAAFFFVAGMAIVFTVGLPEFEGQPPISRILFTIFVLIYQLAMLPVIAALPAPAWAKASGFTWIVIDIMLVMLSFYGEGSDIVEPLRRGINIATAIWIFGVSKGQQGVFRWVGFLIVPAGAGISLIGPFLSSDAMLQVSGPGVLLLIAWIIIAGNRLGKSDTISA